MKNPYRIETPAVISFSGGRSSGFMLWKILEAYNHQLPDDIKVVFCNTGLEHHETYEFIHRIEQNWCKIVWLEYCLDEATKEIPRDDGIDVITVTKQSYKIVDYETASRNGEPFDLMIMKKKFLPNPIARICTQRLKVEPLQKYIEWSQYSKAIGLRADEPRRVVKMRDRDDVILPMADAKHHRGDVMEFWIGEDMDLNLPLQGNIFSNCVGCFLKGYRSLEDIARTDPKYFEWWINTEVKTGHKFRNDRPCYATIKANAYRQLAFDFGDTVDCFCTD